MTIYFTSDLHFGHDRDFIYKPRGFVSSIHHDDSIIDDWNYIVKPTDEVYILGDLMLGRDHQYGIECLQSLNGNLHFTIGNHDTANRIAEYEQCGLINEGHATVLKADGYKFFLCHYAAATSCIENAAAAKYHLISLHGHTHHKEKFETDNPFQYNVALDAHDNYPVSIYNIIFDIDVKINECLSFL